MQIFRTIFWVLLLIGFIIFSFNNQTSIVVKIWEGLVLETPPPVLVLMSFLLGLVPMWLVHRAVRWRLNRRINALQHSILAATPAPPLATSTQLENANPEASAT